MHLFPW